MAQVRLFGRQHGLYTEYPAKQIASIKWVDTILDQPTATVRLLPSARLTPANAPTDFLIVPSERESLNVPAYGPYEVKTYGWNGEGYTLECAIGVDFAARFAAGDDSLLSSIANQIRGFATGLYEPFLEWTASPGESDGPNVAKLGSDGFISLAVSPLYNIAAMSELEGVLANFGLSAYMLVEWPAVGTIPEERLAVWPLHPLIKTTTDDLGGSTSTAYSIQPRIGAVQRWTNGLPTAFISPNIALANTAAITNLRNVQYAPDLKASDLFNTPHGSTKPSYKTRRINVGYRLLGVEGVIQLYHTGEKEPALYRNPQEATTGGSTKMGEEVQRWNLQNSAASLTLKRYVADTWAAIDDEFFAPLQIVTMPESIFPEGWDTDNHRAFTIRQITHEFTGEAGYSQEIASTLWQGPFERLTAIVD